jgi:hypothetical protein
MKSVKVIFFIGISNSEWRETRRSVVAFDIVSKYAIRNVKKAEGIETEWETSASGLS